MVRPDGQYFARSLRAAAREAIWLAASRHRQGPRQNILLFASRRGGSTFAMELISANRGVRPLNQPLETLSRNLTAAQATEIPRFQQGQITSLTGPEEERMRSLVERLMRGEVVINAPTRFWRSDFEVNSERLILKLTDCKPIIGWFDEHFSVDVVYLTRHPIPQALSCIRNGWTLTVDAHLRDPTFVEENLTSSSLALAHDIIESSNPLHAFVLNWALENVKPMRLLPERPAWTHVRYEDCVLSPDQTLARLADRLDLTDVERMRAMLSKPSQSSGRSAAGTRRAISRGRGATTVHAWREQVDADDERWCHDTLERFGIDPAVVLPSLGR